MSEFDSKAATWEDNPERWERAHAVADAIAEVQRGTDVVLEYGAGTGIVGRLLAPNAKRVDLVDASAEMVVVAQRKADEAGLTNVQASHVDLTTGGELTGAYDLIALTLVLHHVTDPQALLTRFAGLLNPGGRIAIADLDRDTDQEYHAEGFGGHHGFDRDELAAQLEAAGFTNLRWQTVFQMPKTTQSGHRRIFPIFLVTGELAAG